MNRIKVIVPIAMDEAGVANRAQQLRGGFVRLGFGAAKFQKVLVCVIGASVPV